MKKPSLRFAILSRNRGLHSVRRLLTEAKKARIACDVINPLDCQLVLKDGLSLVWADGKPIPEYNVILPRIGASITDYGLAVVKQFESQGAIAVNSRQAIADSRDKMRCLQILSQAGIQVPTTILSRSPRGRRLAVEMLGGFPLIMKVLRGTQGVGVMLMHTPTGLSSVLDTLQSLEQDVMLQQFLAEGAGRDYRAFVIGDKVVAAMMRTAAEGEFRANIHQGGEGNLVKLTKEYERVAIQSAKSFGLGVAGVDIMESGRGPMVIEVNSSPGFEGIEQATGLNIAKLIIQHMVALAKKRPRKKR